MRFNLRVLCLCVVGCNVGMLDTVIVHGNRDWSRVVFEFLRLVRDVVEGHGRNDRATVA